MSNKRFFTVIIGTELLNGRREDAHFKRVNSLLLDRNWEHCGSFVIEDRVDLIRSVFELIKDTKDSVMFCYGGIGATPDDYTREVAGSAFCDGEMEQHSGAKKLIEDRFGENAYPNRINMAYLPQGADLIPNPINQVPGFSLESRFFFMPGFPEMSSPMSEWVVEKYFPRGVEKFAFTVSLDVSEERFMDFMRRVPQELELSSLPIMKNFKDGKYTPAVTLSLRGYEQELLEKWANELKIYIEKNGWEYKID